MASRLIGLLILILLSVPVVVQIPAIQKKLVEVVTSFLEDKIDATMSIGGVHVKFTGALALRDILVVDKNPYGDPKFGWEKADTVLKVGQVTASFSLKGALKHEGLHIGRVYLKDASFHLVTEPNEYRSNISRIMGVIPDEAPPPQEEFPVFDVRRIRLDNVRFKMNNYLYSQIGEDRRSPRGVHFEDMNAVLERLRMRNLRFAYGRMSGKLDRCSIREERGYRVNQLSAKFAVGTGLTSIEDIHLLDNWSDVNLGMVTMKYDKGAQAFLRFISDVHLAVSADDAGILDFRTITGICGALEGNESAYEIKKIRAEGPVDNIQVRNVVFKELTTGVSGSVSCGITGLPDVNRMKLDGTIRNVHVVPKKGCDFVKIWSETFSLDFPNDHDELTLNGSVKGYLRDLAITADISSEDAGAASCNLKILNILDPTGLPIRVDGAISTKDLDAGRIAGIQSVGPVSMHARAGMTVGSKLPNFNVDSLDISRLNLLGYDYSDISARAFKQGDKMLARIEGRDPNLQASFLADCTGTPDGGDFNFRLAGDLKKADLHALNLDKRGEVSEVSAQLGMFVSSIDGNNLDGDLRITDIVLTNDSGPHDIGDINADVSLGDKNLIDARSSFADIRYEGSSSLDKFLADILEATAKKELPALFPGGEKTDRVDESYSLSADFHDSRELLQFVMPGLYVEDSTSVWVNLKDGLMTGSVNSGRIAFGANYLKDVSINASNLGGRLTASLTSKEMMAGGVTFAQTMLSADADDNHFNLGFRYVGEDNPEDSGSLRIGGELRRDEADSLLVTAKTGSSSVKIGDDRWYWNESEFSFKKNHAIFDNFMLKCGDQSIKIDGGVSLSNPDTLQVDISNLGLQIVDALTRQDMGFTGNLSGYAKLVSPIGDKFRIVSKLVCDSLAVKGTDAGTITLAGRWNDDKQAVDIFAENKLDGRKTFNAYASYQPNDKTLDAKAELDRLNPGVAAPFLTSIFDSLGGFVSGGIRASGRLDELDVASNDLKLDGLSLTIAATGVTYLLDGPLNADEHGISLDGITIRDTGNGEGHLSGRISYSHLHDINLNTRLTFNNLQVVNSEETSGKNFYGHMLASGNATVKGPVSNLQLDGVASTTGEGDIHVPLGSSLTGTTSDLLTFVQKEKVLDTYEQMMLNEANTAAGNKKKSSGNIAIRANVTATPGVKAFIEIDKATGNILTAYGDGTVNLFMQPSKDVFTLDGKYNITGGSYHFQTAAILNKEFTIQDGSSLTFNGDVLDSRMDVTALYNLKTSLSTLISDTTSVSTRRAVQCGIHLTESIKNLNVGFSIDVPDLDPTTKSKVESALNTEDKVQKQFVALLLFGTFLPTEQSGVVNSTNMLYSNVSEVMSGQINSILQKLDIPVDLGFGYQQNDGGTDIFDVAISTQLFNNRVVVNGSVGNRKYRTSSNPYGDVVGDLDIDIKLDKSGKLRATVFSHSADEYTSYLDFSQRNGAGISYQMEYDKVKYLVDKDSQPSDSLKVIHIKPKQER